MGSGISTKYEKTYFYKLKDEEPLTVAEKKYEYNPTDIHTIESHNDEKVIKFCEEMVSRKPYEDSSYAQNLANTAQHFEINDKGFFGEPGDSRNVWILKTENPMQTAMDFFNEIGEGGLIKYTSNHHGIISYLGDGKHIMFRPYPKTEGSPAVDVFITVSGNLINKLHFIGN